MGIEPTSSAWEAEVIAIIRRPQSSQYPPILQADSVTSHGCMLKERCHAMARTTSFTGRTKGLYKQFKIAWLPDFIKPCFTPCHSR